MSGFKLSSCKNRNIHKGLKGKTGGGSRPAGTSNCLFGSGKTRSCSLVVKTTFTWVDAASMIEDYDCKKQSSNDFVTLMAVMGGAANLDVKCEAGRVAGGKTIKLTQALGAWIFLPMRQNPNFFGNVAQPCRTWPHSGGQARARTANHT